MTAASDAAPESLPPSAPAAPPAGKGPNAPTATTAPGTPGDDTISMRGAGVVGAMTLISRLMGFFRDRLFVRYFGSGPVADAFLLAFTIPNLLRRLFGEGALSSAFVPVFIEAIEKARGGDEAERLAAHQKAMRLANVILTRLAVLLALVTAVVCIGSAIGALWVFNDNGPESAQRRLTLWLLALMMPYNILINSAAIIGGILNAHRRFTVVAFAPVMLNVVNISILWFMPELLHFFHWQQAVASDPLSTSAGAYLLAIGVLIAGCLQVLVLVPSLFACGFIPKPAWQPDSSAYHKVVKNFIPLVLGLAVFQLNTLADRLMAYYLVPGSGAVTSLYIGNQLMQLPLALIATAMGTAALPTLSLLYSRKDMEGYKSNLLLAFRQTFFLTVPAAVGLFVLAHPLIDLAFGTGQFAGYDPAVAGRFLSGAPADPISRASLVMQCYAPGLVFFATNVLLTRGFYAMQDTRTPLKISLIALTANVIGNYTLLYLYGDRLGEASLALSSSISGAIQTLLLCWVLFRKIGGTTLSQVSGWLVRTGFATCFGWLLAYMVCVRLLGDTGGPPDPNNEASNFLTGFVKDFIYIFFVGTTLYMIYATWFSHYRIRDGKVVTTVAPLLSFKMITDLFRNETPYDERADVEYRLPRDVIALTSMTWIVFCSLTMGLFCWHMLHSLPPADPGRMAVRVSRALVPLIAGGLWFYAITSTLNLEEYHRWMEVLRRRRAPAPKDPS
ncbi:MAG: murein biosynthesis integral membrane protein MurJ [Planctomycetota bacterium]